MNQKYMIYMYLLKARTFIALLLVIAFFSVMVPNFLTASNLLIMTQHVAITGLLAIGMTLVILTGGIDLSVGAVVISVSIQSPTKMPIPPRGSAEWLPGLF
ncbi:hypothetical protein EIMP300_72200 [Escherichia coli]|uniref:Sugar ABC transporter permease n=1 Tax=Escherichia coli TaxID=562 RepID=A0A8S0G175_ECOLX|nr:hypothetical protein EIMP300_72200 [Escherichia coli]